MKKLILTVIVAIAGWLGMQAQSTPAPEKYNEFIEQIAEQNPTTASILMNATMESLSKDAKDYRQMLELAERRFSDPADPIHNEYLYMIVLNHAVENYVLSATEKEKQRLLLEGAKKNMEGSIAADFDFVTPDGKDVQHLKDLHADNILVFFNNPDCDACETVKERLSTNEFINQLVKDKKLIVLAIYPYDDQKMWKKTKYPKMMINGWNQSRQIEYAELYDLPTLPCFYLLDKDYKVLMKNEGSLNKVEARLKNPEAQAMAASTDLKTVPTHQAQQPKPAVKQQPVPAPADDPKTILSEQLLGYLINNQSQEMYDHMASIIKERVQANYFDGALKQVEAQMGKYQSHEAWEIQLVRGIKSYTSLMHFENGPLGIVIFYDTDNNVVGMNIVPPEVINK